MVTKSTVTDLCERVNYSDIVQELTTVQELSERVPISEHSGVLSECSRWNDLKVFVKTLTVDDPDALARFRHEARVAASLQHPQVVPLLATTPTQLIFPYLPGGTLREALQGGPMTVGQATEVTLGVLGAVVYMHSVGVTHHDLKPENVLLLGGQPKWDAVRIIDFGMSHSRDLPLDIHSGTRMGTPHFMAPEQFRGVRGDSRSDIYSVGVLLFDCLAGYPPFDDALGWLAGINTERLDLPGPQELQDVIAAALARDPADRPATAAEMQRLLVQARTALGLPALEQPAAEPEQDQPERPVRNAL